MLESIKEVTHSLGFLSEKVLLFTGLSVVFGMLGTILNRNNRTVWSYLISTLAAPPIGLLAGFFATEQGYSDSLVLIIVAICSVLAQDIIRFILAFGVYMNKHSEEVFSKVLKKKLVDKTKNTK